MTHRVKEKFKLTTAHQQMLKSKMVPNTDTTINQGHRRSTSGSGVGVLVICGAMEEAGCEAVTEDGWLVGMSPGRKIVSPEPDPSTTVGWREEVPV